MFDGTFLLPFMHARVHKHLGRCFDVHECYHSDATEDVVAGLGPSFAFEQVSLQFLPATSQVTSSLSCRGVPIDCGRVIAVRDEPECILLEGVATVKEQLDLDLAVLRKLRGSVDMERLKQRTTVAASKIASDPLTCVILKAALKKEATLCVWYMIRQKQ